MQFNADKPPKETNVIGFFGEYFKLLNKAKIETKGRELVIWEEVIEKVVEGGAKAAFQFIFYTREIDCRYQQGIHLVHITSIKVQIQENSIKDSRNKEPKLKAQKL